MRVSVVCHGNVARSQVLHHYLAEYADRNALDLDLFSCGTAPIDFYPEVARMLAEVQHELLRRGLNRTVKRNLLDDEALRYLEGSDWILVADQARRQEILSLLSDQTTSSKVMLFYEFIGEGPNDFVDTYDARTGAQDPGRFIRCFDELERIAKLAIQQMQRSL